MEKIDNYIAAYPNYVREISGIEGLVFAPFHILATENKTYFDKQYPWHLEEIVGSCKYNPKHLMVTPNIKVDLTDEQRKQAAIDWWMDRTASVGKGWW